MKIQNERFITNEIKNYLMRSSLTLKSMFYLVIALLFFSCQKIEQQTDKTAINNGEDSLQRKKTVLGTADLFDIACTNSATNKIEIYSPQNTNGANWGSPKWSWMPTTGEGYTSAEVSAWINGSSSTANTGDPFEVKLRNSSVWGGTSQVVATVGGRLATVFAYPGKEKLWARDMGTAVWPHSVELIPNGNVAVAVSTGSKIYLYNTASGV